MTVYHVRPRDDGQWEIKKRGAERATEVGTQARMKAKVDKYVEEGDTKVLHNADGSVLRREKVDGSRERSRANVMKGVRRQIGDSPFDNF